MLRLFAAVIFLLASLGAAAADFLEAKFPNGATVQIHLRSANCPEGKRLATWFSPDKAKQVNGCYVVSDDGVLTILWADGDESTVWAKVFKPQDGI